MDKVEEVNELNTILNTVKKTIGISIDDSSFDVDLILYINSVILILSQLGLSEADTTPIIDDATTWIQFLGDRKDLEIVKSYIHFKVKLMFDPPSNTASIKAITDIISEHEWRITNSNTIKEVIINE